MRDWKAGQKAWFDCKYYENFYDNVVTIVKDQWQWVDAMASIHYLVRVKNTSGQEMDCNILMIKPLNKVQCCSTCGSTEVFRPTRVNPNTKEEKSIGMENEESWCEGHKECISFNEVTTLDKYLKKHE